MAKHGLKEIQNLKDDIEVLSGAIAKAEGAVSSAMDSLRELGLDSVKAAEKRIAELQKDITKKEKKIQKVIEDIQEALNEIDN